MIITTIAKLKKSLKTYSKAEQNEVVGLVWYRKKFFKDDVENKKFLTNDVFEEALYEVDDTEADSNMADQIINRLRQLEEEAAEEAELEKESAKEEE